MSTAKENERFFFLPLFKTFNFGWVEKYLSHFKNMKIIPNMLGEEKAAIHYFSTINQHKKEYVKSLCPCFHLNLKIILSTCCFYTVYYTNSKVAYYILN